MADNKSKAEKLAEGKKKLKKFQSKNKGKPNQESSHEPTPEQDSFPEAVPETVADQSSTAHFFAAGSAGQDFPSFPIQTSAPCAEPITCDNAPNQSTVDMSPINPFQSQTLDNFSQLSQKFTSLEQELLRNLSTTSPQSTSQYLESQIEELGRQLADEKQKSQNLEIRLREQYSNVDDLTLKLQQSQISSVSQVQTELGPLKDQLDNQIRTVAILVGEKAELSANLSAAEVLTKCKELENEELHAKLNASRHQVQKLKEDLAGLRKSHERFDSSQQNLCTAVETTRDELSALRKAHDDAKEEILELRRKLELKTIDLSSLETKHTEKLKEIDGLYLRLTQLSGVDEDPLLRDRAADANVQQRIALEAQIQELLLQVEKANNDRDTAATHYQNYVQQLNKERETWILKVQEVTKEKDDFAKRDQELVRHIGELEKQMQQQRSLQAKVNQTEGQSSPGAGDRGDTKEFEEKIMKLENDMEVLQAKLTDERENVRKISDLLKGRDERLESLESEAERLRNSHVDPHQITATLESEKVAASRAMTQNQELRAQLEEMQRAFVQMTNDKANLMTELESERYLGREMRSKYEEWDTELRSLQHKLYFKDQEMIRLAHESTEQQKNILMLQQEVDQLRHLEVNKRNQSHLQAEIVKQREQIARLQAMIKEKESEAHQLNGESQENGEGGSGAGDGEGHIEANGNSMEVSVAEEVGEELKTDITSTEIVPEEVEVQVLPTEQAMVKLQERFTRTMDEIAELTEEKQRLEHLVIQLQGETETIGEYIALYQSQRKLLRQREIEKDIQVQKIEADREEMKEKLLKLNSLVELMLAQRNINVHQTEAVNGGGGVEIAGSVPELAPGAVNSASLPLLLESQEAATTAAASRETAEQILDLLTEIKTQNTNFLTDSVHTNCACCSGKLITV